MGGEATRYAGMFAFSANATAGVYANIASMDLNHSLYQEDTYSSTDSAGIFESDSTQLSGVFTAGLAGYAQWYPGVYLRYGYQFLLATDFAAAPHQLSPLVQTFNEQGQLTSTAFAAPTLDQGRALFLHGPFFGIECLW